eukprot:7811680-Alexandrium_andersonii.AAC.1
MPSGLLALCAMTVCKFGGSWALPFTCWMALVGSSGRRCIKQQLSTQCERRLGVGALIKGGIVCVLP